MSIVLIALEGIMAKREFLMLAHTLNVDKHSVAGCYVSEKLDGCRAFWDGGISRNLPASEVPFANTEKDFRLKNEVIATGLWSRYGKVIHAPDWFLNALPPVPLDGELFMGHGQFQSLVSCVKRHDPGPEWRDVRYMAFDIVPFEAVFADGKINNTNMKKEFVGVFKWVHQRHFDMVIPYQSQQRVFRSNVHRLKIILDNNYIVMPLEQELLPFNQKAAFDRIDELCKEVVSRGGEGVMIRRPESIWVPSRSWDLLKHKPFMDAEGVVVGYQFGRETDKGSKLLGLMGSLQVEFNGHRFLLSGFTDEERILESDQGQCEAAFYAENHPGKMAPDWISAKHFPRGSEVTFKYRELTDDGIPKEARYWRKIQ